VFYLRFRSQICYFYIQRYLYLGLFSTSNSKLRRAADFLNGMGTVIHHGAASFIISMLVVGTIPESRYVLNASLILVMQHWISLLAYVSVPLYSAIELVSFELI